MSAAWLDFNDAPEQSREPILAADLEAQTRNLRAQLLERLPEVMRYLFPDGAVRGGQFLIGDITGQRGDSLVIEMSGAKAGMGHDFATGEGFDIIGLWAGRFGLSTRTDFPRLMHDIAVWLHAEPMAGSHPSRKSPPVDDLGPHTAKWNYLNAQGELIACVYRYDPPSGKQYRPWDVKAQAKRAPDPRPLYNQPAMAAAREVVLAEGEKAAQALIERGVCATTAMNGAGAPVHKTDWSPVAGKKILIWPDKDAPGWKFAEHAGEAMLAAGALSVAILLPPDDKPEGWDAADAIQEKFDIESFLAKAPRKFIDHPKALIPLFSLDELLSDTSPMPEDLIAPRVLTPGGLLVFGGAPKVGKSDFMLAWLANMAAGGAFLGMRAPRALNIVYLQAEVQYDYLRERVQGLALKEEALMLARHHLLITPQFNQIFNTEGLEKIIQATRARFTQAPPDIIVVDPVRNVFDGGTEGGENDNDAMLHFLRERIGHLRQAINPRAGVILVHHTKKMLKRQAEEDPFQGLSGASSLRGFYSTGMILFRPDESRSERQLIFELRNGPAIANKWVDKVGGRWVELHAHSERITNKEYGKKLDAERQRQRDVIVELIAEEALQGKVFTSNQFAEFFEGKGALGSSRTIRNRISALATQGQIKFFQDASRYRLPSPSKSAFGYLCVEHMRLGAQEERIDPETGEILNDITVLPTHFKCPHTGASLPVENPHVWVYQEGEDQ